ncbi:MAG: TetR/AcrR family transcriptional regulator [Ilumatobacteraceae bacterium]|jgi:AcrR family transcriptional regulator|nr:TetR/AcrR family transcriptional regulator [Ilumatobacteraceae bacterium]
MSTVLDTRSRLIEATIEAIAAGGEGSVRVHNIAEQAEVREPSVYHFFKNRKELVEAAQAERYRRSYYEMILPFKAMASGATSKQEFLDIILQIFSVMYQQDRATSRSTRINVLGSAQTSKFLSQVVADVNYEISQALADVFAEAQEKGWVRTSIDAQMLSLWLMGQVNSRNLPEMDLERSRIEEWDKISLEAVMTFIG